MLKTNSEPFYLLQRDDNKFLSSEAQSKHRWILDRLTMEVTKEMFNDHKIREKRKRCNENIY